MTTKITEQNISELANAGVNWQSVFTGDGSTGLTAVAGRGYFIDTTSGTVTVTLPNDASSSVGDTIIIRDYAGTFATNNVTITSTAKISEADADGTLSTNDLVMTLTYVNSTKGWVTMENEAKAIGASDVSFISATGGTITTSGDFKIHTFTGDGCFVVTTAGSGGCYPSVVDYLVVAGGGAGGAYGAGGGGAGGFREAKSGCAGCWTTSPLATPTGITVTATTYPITVGGGGAGATHVCGSNVKSPGSNSVFSTITSTGGGGGGTGGGNPSCTGNNPVSNNQAGDYGGSGGGVFDNRTNCAYKGVGNSPPVSPPQGNPGGRGVDFPPSGGGGGGGAGGAGANATTPGTGPSPANKGGNGGAGVTSSITGSPLLYSAGGGGGIRPGGQGGGDGGSRPSPRQGGSGAPHPSPDTSGATGQSGVANTGGGGGGGSNNAPTTSAGGSGGKGVVVIRYKFQ